MAFANECVVKKSLAILLFCEFLVAVALGQAGIAHRSELDRAFAEWHTRPTTQSRAALERQKSIIQVQRWTFTGVLFAVLAVGTIIVNRLRKGEPDGAANRSQPIRPETERSSVPAGSDR